MSDKQTISTIIKFWFAEIGDGFDVSLQHKLWYGGGVETDEKITSKFGELMEKALAGELSHWSNNTQGVMALVLLIDQFTRNIYRGQATAFSGDEQAKEVVKNALKKGVDRKLTMVQRSFLYMPLEHSEQLIDQQFCVQLFTSLLAEAPVDGVEVIKSSLDHAVKHLNIIELFGRFPHRNKVLGRSSTRQEIDYLNDGGARFGQ
jgi:uncharacterized protein (DUF924 family)